MLNIHQITFRLILMLNIIILLIALAAEEYFKIPPCDFCLYQRNLYLFAVICCIFGMLMDAGKHIIATVLNLIYVGIISVALVQLSIEYDIVEKAFSCQTIVPSSFETIEQYKEKLMEAKIVTCDQPFTVIAISVAGYSLIFSSVLFFFLLTLNLTQLFFRHDTEVHSA